MSAPASPAPASREEIEALLRAGDPLEAARAAGVTPGGGVAVVREGEVGRLADGDLEGAIDEHRAAHAAGRPSEAAVAYGAGHDPAAVAGRIADLAALARETGMLRAVCPVPAEGRPERPGSWGVEDLTVIAACRLAMPSGVEVRPHWVRLGAAACQIAVAFGATEWLIPAGDASEPEHLAAGVGATVRQA
jgi:hypothetical protein